MNERYVGYVLSVVDYKDNDCLINVLYKEGVVCLKARGIKKINSKNSSAIMNYAYSEFETVRGSKTGYLTLKGSRLLNYSSFLTSDLEYLGVINFVSEGIELLEDKKDSFICFANCLEAMEKKQKSEFVLIAFLNYFLNKEGCKLNSNECICCASKEKIVKFSFDNGGFLCRNCYYGVNDEVTYLKNMRILTKINYNNIEKVDMNLKYAYEYIKKVIRVIENKAGIYFKCKSFLLRVLKKEEV